MKRTMLLLGALAFAALLAATGPLDDRPVVTAEDGDGLHAGTGPGDELWAAEQNGNQAGGFGSVVIFNAHDMSTKTIIKTDGTDTRTCLGAQTAPNCTKFDRPHTVLFTNDFKYAFVVATVSANIGVFDAETKQLLQHFPTAPGTAPHAVFPVPNDTRAFAIGIAGGRPYIQEYMRDFTNAAAPFSLGKFQGLDDVDFAALAALADDPADAAAILSPAAFPRDPVTGALRAVCPGYSADSKDLYVTLFFGGMLIFDIDKPKGGFYAISEVYDASVLPANGCGLILDSQGTSLYIDSGDHNSSDVLVLDLRPNADGPRAGRARNTVLASIHTSGDGVSSPLGACQTQFAASCNDLHSLHFVRGGDELWFYSRTDDVALVLDTRCGASGSNPYCNAVKDVVRFDDDDDDGDEGVFDSPDLSIVNRGGLLAYVTMRGPEPQPTAAHAVSGTNPGIAVIDLHSRELLAVVPLVQGGCVPVTPAIDGECDDPHGVAYRLSPAPAHLDFTRRPGGM